MYINEYYNNNSSHELRGTLLGEKILLLPFKKSQAKADVYYLWSWKLFVCSKLDREFDIGYRITKKDEFIHFWDGSILAKDGVQMLFKDTNRFYNDFSIDICTNK